MSQIVPERRPVKSALRKSNLSGSFIVGKYRFSPYMGCEHGCLYCDGRAERYYFEGDFQRDIVARPNLPELLENELPKLRERGFISIGSGISDAYQPVEREEKIMARCAAILARHDHPATVMTKSSLALRDLDVWAAVHSRSCFMFLVSLTHARDDTRRSWEPGASSVSERLEALRRFKEAGCITGVLAMPLLPHITDTGDHLRRLYGAVAEVGVDFIMPGGLTLRPGRQKDLALAHLRHDHPNLVPEYEEIYGEERTSGAPRNSYSSALYRRFSALNREFGLPWLVPHRIYREHLHVYDEVNVLLHHMVELYEARGTNTMVLRSVLKRYLSWLTERKRGFNRHPSWDYAELDGELRSLCLADRAQGETPSATLSETVGNPKTARFICKIVLERKTFDYLSLSLC